MVLGKPFKESFGWIFCLLLLIVFLEGTFLVAAVFVATEPCLDPLEVYGLSPDGLTHLNCIT